MNLHSACRVLLCGATLLAVTVTAAPGDAQAQPAPSPSPCLDHRPAPANSQQPAAQKRHQWRSPCYLADAEKKEDEHEDAADAARQDIQRRLDDIDLLGRHAAPAGEESQLWWIAPDRHGPGDNWQPPAAGAPVSWAPDEVPLMTAGATHGLLRQDGAHGEAAIPAVPEPASVTLLVTGLAMLAGVASRRRGRRS